MYVRAIRLLPLEVQGGITKQDRPRLDFSTSLQHNTLDSMTCLSLHILLIKLVYIFLNV